MKIIAVQEQDEYTGDWKPQVKNKKKIMEITQCLK